MPKDDTAGMHVGLSAVTGDLTVAVGFADGSVAGVSDNVQMSIQLKLLKLV